MKKTFLAILVAATLVACAKEDVISQNNEAIGFKQAFVDNSVRSVEDPSYVEGGNMFTDFAVYGFVEGATLFDGTTVSQSIVNNDLQKTTWDYEGTQYWIAGAKYNFNAIAPKTNGNWTKTAATKDGVTLSFENNGTTDLLYAKTAEIEGKASGNDVVGFTFSHVLSKVKFSFVNNYNASNAKIKVSNIKITDAYETATVALSASAPAWTAQDGTLELIFGNATADDATSIDALAFEYGTTLESYKELLLIPGAGRTDTVIKVEGQDTTVKAYTVTFTVELFIGDAATAVKTYTHTVMAPVTPEAGKCYDIVATITPENIDPAHQQEPIEFTVNTLPGWGEPTEVPAN